MNSNKKIDAVLLDLDGVVIDSFEVVYIGLKKTFQKYGNENLDREEYEEKYWGTKIEDIIVEDLGWGKEASDYYFSVMFENFDKAKLCKGVKETLDSISKMNKKIGLVTNAPKKYTNRYLDFFDLKDKFKVIVTSDDVVSIKPSSEQLIEAYRALEITPERTVFVGDSDTDLTAGKKAGCTVVGVGVNGDYKINNMRELLDLEIFENHE